MLINDTAKDPRFLRARSVVSTFRTALCVPLPGHDGQPLGMVQLDRRNDLGWVPPRRSRLARGAGRARGHRC